MKALFTAIALLFVLTGSASADLATVTPDPVLNDGSPGSASFTYFNIDHSSFTSISVSSSFSDAFYLYRDDGDLTSDDAIAYSSSTLYKNLAAGDYIVIVGSFPFMPGGAIAGVNSGWTGGDFTLKINAYTAHVTIGSGEVTSVPELDPGAGGSALALLIGGVLVLGDRRRRKA